MEEPKYMRIAIVSEFNQKDYFQWYMSLVKFQKQLKIMVLPVKASYIERRKYPIDNHYWDWIKQADAVYIYVTRVDHTLEWWTLPIFIKRLMKPDAKMIVQSDDEFLWLWYPDHVWWRAPNPDNHGNPEQFFKDTGILEVPDAHFSILNNSPFKAFTTKPVYTVWLPQLVRYDLEKFTVEHKGHNIAVMLHGNLVSKIDGILENIIEPNQYSITMFNNVCSNHPYLHKLPKRAYCRAYGRLPIETYIDILALECDIGLDENDNYLGWSRFAMECAITHMPCVGSTPAVKLLFPELYTEKKDYVKQNELIKRLREDKEFYKQMVDEGRKRCFKELGTENLCKQFVQIFEELGAKRELTARELLAFFLSSVGESIPQRPINNERTIFDPISRKIIGQTRWDELYGLWKEILENRNI